MKKFNTLENGYWHPWLLAVYYVAFPFVINFQHLILPSIFLPLVIVALGTTLLFVVCYAFCKKTYLASIITSVSLILFFSYPPLFSIIRIITSLMGNPENGFDITISISKYWIIISFIVILSGVILLSNRIPKLISLLTIALNLASIFLILAVSGYLITKLNTSEGIRTFQKRWDEKIKEDSVPANINSIIKRDIYLIVLDGYGSREVLDEIYDYDNRWFEEELHALGFHIIPNAQTNYNQTRTSFSSLLNMQYLDDVASEVGAFATDAHPLIQMIQDNLVVNRLRGAGYTIINFPSGYEYTEGIAADYQIKKGVYLDNFSQTLIWNSVAYPFIHKNLYDWHRDTIMNSIEGISDLTDFPSPRLVIAHIFAPHPPFVFDGSGKPITPPYSFTAIDADTLIQNTSLEYYKTHYPDQLEFVSRSILKSIQEIIKNSEVQPIIILSGDHGPALTVSLTDTTSSSQYERMHILNALYLPDFDYSQINPDHTPVNTFRVILNAYFGENMELLENRSYISSFDHPYQFMEYKE